MPVTTIDNRTVKVDEEGFLTDFDEWSPELADSLSAQIGLTLTDRHRAILRWLREDFLTTGECATLRRVSTQRAVPVKELFGLFPVKPAKKMAYVAGLPKPRGCV